MLKKSLKKILNYCGYELVNTKSILNQSNIDSEKMVLFNKVSPFTMTSFQRVGAISEAIEYLCKYKIEGDIVECGVWRGGSMMAAAISLINKNDIWRKLYLYDTFEGMSEPDEKDVSVNNLLALSYLNTKEKSKDDLIWAYSTLEEVKNNIYQTNYPKDKIFFVQGKVEDTLPNKLHSKIALLRLDTDWYESTKCELENLFPLLVDGGILIIDDYGYWKGCKKAVDEYFEKNNIRIFLNIIDDTGRIAIKL